MKREKGEEMRKSREKRDTSESEKETDRLPSGRLGSHLGRGGDLICLSGSVSNAGGIRDNNNNRKRGRYRDGRKRERPYPTEERGSSPGA